MKPLHLLLALLLGSVVSVPLLAQSSPRTVHVFVTLANNVNQGIVPVPAKLGNGEDAEREHRRSVGKNREVHCNDDQPADFC